MGDLPQTNISSLASAAACVEAVLHTWRATKQGSHVYNRFLVHVRKLPPSQREWSSGRKVAGWLATLCDVVPGTLASYARAVRSGINRSGETIADWFLVVDWVRMKAEGTQRGLQAVDPSEPMGDEDFETIDRALMRQPRVRALHWCLFRFGQHGTDYLRLTEADVRMGVGDDGCWLMLAFLMTKTNLDGHRPAVAVRTRSPPHWVIASLAPQRKPLRRLWAPGDLTVISSLLKDLPGRKDLRSYRRRRATDITQAKGLDEARQALFHSVLTTTQRYVSPWEHPISM